jgi:transposase
MIRKLVDIEREAVLAAVEELGIENKPEIAKQLGVCLKTLYSKLHKYLPEAVGPRGGAKKAKVEAPDPRQTEIKMPGQEAA